MKSKNSNTRNTITDTITDPFKKAAVAMGLIEETISQVSPDKETIIKEYSLFPKTNIQLVVTSEDTFESYKLVNTATKEEFAIGAKAMATSLLKVLTTIIT